MSKRFNIDMEKPNSWRDRASNLDEWIRWDRAMRRKLGWRAGLSFWSETNVTGSRSLLARHWPHRLCWSWSIWVGRHREGFDGPRHLSFVASRKYRFARLWFWWVYLNVSWQDSDWMAGLTYRDNAPKIYWKHHLEHAVPAGTA
jgi:hypothetical protein